MGFGMTTVLLNIHNAGFFPISAMILAMGLFYGGIAQIIAGIPSASADSLISSGISRNPV
jgi:succinate-acetate transporter protein